VARKEVDALLLDKLPERLSEKQKGAKIHNLLTELRGDGKIFRQGSRAKARWVMKTKAEKPEA